MRDCRPNPGLLRAALLGTIALAAACTAQPPTAPEPAAVGSGTTAGAGAMAPTFPLDGTFTVTMSSGSISGKYSGVSDGWVDAQTAGPTTLRLVITEGTNSLAGAAGNLKGDGSGAFTGEGSFSLSLKGPVSAAGTRLNLRITFTGIASVSCVGEQIQVTQRGAGTLDGAAVTGLFTHLVGNTGCES